MMIASSRFLLSSAFVIACCLFWRHGSITYEHASRNALKPDKMIHGQKDFPWGKVEPSNILIWHECYTDFQCARLRVPLNYSEPEGRQAAIALIRLQAAVPSNSVDYQGPILFNPGGPGGSGVDYVLRRGHQFSKIVGPQFDIVGFDPRGASRSIPRVTFYESSVEGELWHFIPTELNSSEHKLADTWARSLVTNRLAMERDNDVLAHINTDNTARDMLKITEAHGFEKLKYWGISYGTIIGATFAAMFPDKVDKLVLDGVDDSEAWYHMRWDISVEDTSKALQSFFDECFFAGPSECAFYAPSPSLIEENLSNLSASIKQQPVPVKSATSYGLVDYNRFRLTIWGALYTPYASWIKLAEGLANLAKGNGTKFYMMQEQTPYKCDCSGEEDYPVVYDREASWAIGCNDGDPISDSYEDTVKFYENSLKVSEWASVWTAVRVGCSGWPDLSKKHFRGPIVGNMNLPILWIGNRADPVTPISSAHRMAKAFPGSVVLSQNSTGHSSITAPSPCTHSIVRAYFANGTLPESGTWCPILGTPFIQVDISGSQEHREFRNVMSLGSYDPELLDATLTLSSMPLAH